MKNRKYSKVPIIIASVVLTLSLTLSTGCGGLFALGALGCTGCIYNIASNTPETVTSPWNLPDETTSETTADHTDETETTTESDHPARPSGTVSIGDGTFTYEEYDPSDFYDSCEELISLASGNDADAVISLYADLLDEYTYIDENGSILYVAYSENPSDEYLSDQYIEIDKMSQECADKLLTAIKAICDGPCANDFKTYVGEEYFDAYSEYEPLTNEQSDLFSKETELVDEYYSAIEDAEYDGTPDSELANIVGPIYLELVQVRTEIAKSYGYDNYADYADENIYCRDFTAEDIEKFCDTVKKFSPEYYDLLYNSSAYYMPYYYMDVNPTTRELLSDLQKYGSMISPLTETSSKLLIDNNLYSIGSSDERMSGAYTISFEESDTPFIFATTDGNATDFTTLTHEFGHFTAFTLNPNPNNLIYSYGSLELSEIHSNGLQALYSYYFDDIFGNYAGAMEAYTVINLLSNVVDGCLLDEFQRKIYADPDMTLDEVNKLYQDLCKEYGDPYSSMYEDADYWWIHVSHSFESPMYYFSYAASGIVALQIWLTSETDMDKAVSIWEQIVEAGPYAYGYMELLEEVGVSDFTNTASVAATSEMALNFIKNNTFTY